jgi:hypothetical protein
VIELPLLAYMQVISGDYGTGRCGYGPTQPCKACTANSCPYSTFGFHTESLGPDGLPLKLGVKPDVIDMVGSIIGGSPAFAVCHQLCVCTFLTVYRLQDVEIARNLAALPINLVLVSGPILFAIMILSSGTRTRLRT